MTQRGFLIIFVRLNIILDLTKYIFHIGILFLGLNLYSQNIDTSTVLKTVEVSATSAMNNKQESAVWIQSVAPMLMRSQGGNNMAEGISFQPGLRIENNCQNCGFTQVRMNGLDGSYTQILFDDMPLYSPLLGVYGLEQIPLNLIERLDVVRGGNNAMFGGNALAGTINIIPKYPIHSSYEAGFENVLTGFKNPDTRFDASFSHLAENHKWGYNLAISARWREAYNHNPEAMFDSNGDGAPDIQDDLSEIPKIRSATLNFRGFYKPTDRNYLTYGVFALREFRRGGNGFNLLPEQSDITEQIDQSSLGVYFKNNLRLQSNQLISFYGAMLATGRKSYYGGKNVTENSEENQAENFYGTTIDRVFVAGTRYFLYTQKINWQVGVEYRLNDVNDQMPAYNRLIDQNLSNLGAYAIATLKMSPRMSADLSTRYEIIQNIGTYTLIGNQANNTPAQWKILNPRVSFLYNAYKNGQYRLNLSYSSRPPQPFDEDLHISTLQGGANIVFTSQNLEPEKAISITAGYNADRNLDGRIMSFSTEVFFTRIKNPFYILPGQDYIISGSDTLAIVDFRQNADYDALVYGVHGEAKIILSKYWEAQAGGTVQQARFTQPIQIFEGVETDIMLRAPIMYGYSALWYRLEKWDFTGSLLYTGSMKLANERLQTLKTTPTFADMSLIAARHFYIKGQKLSIRAGILNIFDAFQNDVEVGPMRDAAYIYGPLRPRSLFLSLVFRSI